MSSRDKVKKYLKERDLKIHNRALHLSIIFIVFFSVNIIIFYNNFIQQSFTLSIGEKSPFDIRAPFDIEDKEATNKLIEKAIASVEPKDKIDPTIQIDVKKGIEKFFKTLTEEIKSVYKDNGITLDEALKRLKEYNSFNLEEDELLFLINASEDTIENLESYSFEVVTQVMSTGIKKEELDFVKKDIEKYILGLDGFSSRQKDIVIKIVNNSIKENTFLDKDETQNRINEAIKNVEKVYIKRGQVIVGEGEIVTEGIYNILVESGLIDANDNKRFITFIGVVLILLLLEILIFAYIYFFFKDIFLEVSKQYLLLIVMLSIILISVNINKFSSYLIPIATSSMLIGILINPRMANAMNLFLATIIAIIASVPLDIFIFLIIGGTAGAISVSNTSQRSRIVIAGLTVSITNLIIIIGYGLLEGHEIKTLAINSLYGIINGVACSVLTIGTLPLWEYLFNILTPIKLLELSNPNHPLLKRLLVEAPGTYHHSIIVGNLSESAAQAIGANGLLARVGAFYHDIGKLSCPYYFKENQLTPDNPHDRLTPQLSSNIIRKHVDDGIELGKKFRLPKEIIDIIKEHHGTTLVKFFYHKAINGEDEVMGKVNQNDFKYKGPEPTTKESAIIMMADSIEAAVRSMTDPTNENIEILIKKIIDDKLESKQLIRCDLTLRDLETIKTAFLNTLMGIFHERIEYPELKEMEMEASSQ